MTSLLGFALNDAQVSIGGVPATVIYSSPNQVNVQVPFDGVGTQIQVAATGGTISISGVPEDQSNGYFSGPCLRLFTTDGSHAAALNQDGTVNSESNPAAEESIVTLFGTAPGLIYGVFQLNVQLTSQVHAPLTLEAPSFRHGNDAGEQLRADLCEVIDPGFSECP